MPTTDAPTIASLAGEAYDAFTIAVRGGAIVTVLRGGAPEWVRDAAREAHGEFGPDNWRYSSIRSAFGAIHDAGEGADVDDLASEWQEANVDIYTFSRLAWLASNLNRAAYCDEGAAEFGITNDEGIVAQIGIGQYVESGEVFASVAQSLCDRLDELTQH